VTWLREQPDDLAALVSRTSEATGIPAAFIEKDFWVVELLRSVSAPLEGAHAVFKGGTSLSKAYGLIDRFSEDVDILLVADGASAGQRDRLLKAVCERAERDLALAADLVFSTRGVVRNVRFKYRPSQRDRRISEGVLLEMGIRGNPDPHEDRPLRSYVAAHAVDVLEVDEAEFHEFTPFTVTVLRPERTLVEKLSLLHHLETLHPEAIAASDKGRHLYDIYHLLGDESTLSAIRKGYVAAAAADAEARSAANGWDYTQRPADGYAASAAFDPAGAKAAAMRVAYERVRPLVFGAFPAFEEVVEQVRAQAALL
jgi:predicted nucleotidyltransferase component of viral defense system